MRALGLGLLAAGLLALVVLGWLGLPGLAPLSVPLDPIEAPLTTFAPWVIRSADDLRRLFDQPAASEANRLIAFAASRSASDFTSAGIDDARLRIRLVRISRDAQEVPQAVAVTADGQLLGRWQITSVPTPDQAGVCVVRRDER